MTLGYPKRSRSARKSRQLLALESILTESSCAQGEISTGDRRNGKDVFEGTKDRRASFSSSSNVVLRESTSRLSDEDSLRLHQSVTFISATVDAHDENDFLVLKVRPSLTLVRLEPNETEITAVNESTREDVQRCRSPFKDSMDRRIGNHANFNHSDILVDYLRINVTDEGRHRRRFSRQLNKLVVDAIHAFVRHYQLQESVSYFGIEVQMGIKLRRENCIGLAKIIFQTGIKLHDNGYVHSTMALYDDLLKRLIGLTHTAARGSATDNAIMIQDDPTLLSSVDVLSDDVLSSSTTATTQHDRHRATQTKSMLNEFLGVYPRMASTLKKLGTIHLQMNDFDMAINCFNAGIKVDEVLLNVCYANIVETLLNIALVHRRRHNYAMALSKYIQVYFLQLRTYGPNSIPVATALTMIALMQYRLKQYASAFELYQETLTIQRDTLGENNITVASTINSLGLCCFYLRLFPHAKNFFYRSLEIRKLIVGHDHFDLAIIWYNLATICVETHEELEAITCYKESLRIELLALSPGKGEGASLSMQNLGYIYQQNGELDEARNYFTQALELNQSKYASNSSGPAKSQIIAKLYNLIGNIHLQKAEVEPMMNCYVKAARSYQDTMSGTSANNETMVISGYTFYAISKLHPQCASTA